MGPPKSEAGKRTLAIPAYILPALRMHLESYAEAGAKGRVFVGAKGATMRRAFPRPALPGALKNRVRKFSPTDALTRARLRLMGYIAASVDG
ncbi:MAG TPA: hypothetical protein VFB74_17605 [Kribbellaceae bacterium]|nr:hypothetical protein [Kribbellaceae bacterium]